MLYLSPKCLQPTAPEIHEYSIWVCEYIDTRIPYASYAACVTVCCNVLQCVAVICNVLQ